MNEWMDGWKAELKERGYLRKNKTNPNTTIDLT
jgi:hypothetical protein